jgi:dynein heavy chain
MVRGELKPIERKIIVALITVDVHAGDVVEQLHQNNISSIFDFSW